LLSDSHKDFYVLRFFLILTAAFVMFFPVAAIAQNNALAGFTEKEKVGFAFYKLINRDPPYDDWIRGTAAYQSAKSNVQLAMIDQERHRLRRGFEAFTPDRDLITIKLPVKVKGGNNPNFAKDFEMQAAGLSKMIEINFMGNDESPYFPFLLGKQWIGMIPQGLEQRSTHYLTPAQFATFCANKNKACEKFEQNIDANVILRTISADAEKPLVLRDVPLWLMMSDLGAIIFLRRDGGLIWEYAMPWYEGARAGSLMTLYDK
jgi:hypothetical protein